MDQSSDARIYCYGTRKRFISGLGSEPQYSSMNAQFWYIVCFPQVLLVTVCVTLVDSLGIDRRIILNCVNPYPANMENMVSS